MKKLPILLRHFKGCRVVLLFVKTSEDGVREFPVEC